MGKIIWSPTARSDLESISEAQNGLGLEMVPVTDARVDGPTMSMTIIKHYLK